MTDTPTSGSELLRPWIWRELERAATETDHQWRTPVLATVDAAGRPRARTVVLRRAAARSRTVAFFTDARSPKVAQLAASGVAVLAFWSSELGWQLRIDGRAAIETGGPAVDRAWRQVAGSPAAYDYLAPQAPGSPLSGDEAARSDDHHLAIVTIEVAAMDWLSLDKSGHRRALIEGDAVTWVVP